MLQQKNLLSVLGVMLVAATAVVAGPPRSSLGKSSSTGFRITADVADQFSTLAMRVHGMILDAYDMGTGRDRPAIFRKASEAYPGTVFYANQPAKAPAQSILTDALRGPAASYALQVPPPPTTGSTEAQMATFAQPQNGTGSPVSIGNVPAPNRDNGIVVVNELDRSLHGGTFLACNRTVAFANESHAAILAYQYQQSAETPPVPDDCVPVRLVLRCAELMRSVPDPLSSHKSIQAVPCYG